MARYDGPLAGTEVGMILFYTDLTAKLWMDDYMSSAPVEVEDFRPATRIRVASTYKEELDAYPDARLWFETESQGYQPTAASELLFARTATRISARSSNRIDPNTEVRAGALFAQFIEWWNDHYEAVAQYEPAYQKLNQIMKWSVLTAWLGDKPESASLAFLLTGTQDRSAWFPTWAAQNKELKFRDWESISFFERSHGPTEAMPLLTSEPFELFGKSMVLEGGVTLETGRTLGGKSFVSDRVAPNLRRASVDYGSLPAQGGGLPTSKGVRYGFPKSDATARGTAVTTSKLRAIVSADVRLRGTFGEVSSREFTRTALREGEVTALTLEGSGSKIGSLSLERSSNGFLVGYRAREVDAGFALGRKLSTSRDPEIAIRGDANIRMAVRAPAGDTYYVQLFGTAKWLKATAEKPSQAKITKGISANVADIEPSALTYRIELLEPGELPSQVLAGGKMIRGPPEPPPGGGTATLMVPDGGVPRPLRVEESLILIDELRLHHPELVADAIREAKVMHGPTSGLLVREVLVALDRGNRRQAAAALDGIRKPPDANVQSVLTEINRRLAGTKLSVASDERAVTRVASPDQFARVTSADEVKPGALIFVEDSASFNNLDLSASVAQSIDNIVGRGIGVVYAIPYGPLRSYRPQRVRIGERQAELFQNGNGGGGGSGNGGASGGAGGGGTGGRAAGRGAPGATPTARVTLRLGDYCFDDSPPSEECPDTAYVVLAEPLDEVSGVAK